MNECCDICTLNHRTDQHYERQFAPIKVKGYRPLDLTDAERNDINYLWHTSRIESHKRYTRMQYVAKWFERRHPEVKTSAKALWFTIEAEIELLKAV